MPLRRVLPFAVLVAASLIAPLAHADLTDEIQVYDDSINHQGQWGLELHLNTTPDGRSIPAYPGEIPPDHGFRTTMEWSYGITDTLEAGLYLPFLHDAAGTNYFAGPRVRLKWIPIKPAEGSSGPFLGLNVEVSAVNERLEQGRPAVELRPIIGYRSPLWLIAFNPVVDATFHPRYGNSSSDFAPALKVARTVWSGTALGLEYYNDFGRIGSFDPARKQNQQLFAALDVTRGLIPFNFGIGRGLNDASDKWTVKAILEIPI
ncbi:hypothetical protein ACFONN_15330 [Dyella humi]|uniref:Transporter n=1 Tax=Dyella humi TaxID=1770547 RepID=A0ABW8IMD9_9GAMM